MLGVLLETLPGESDSVSEAVEAGDSAGDSTGLGGVVYLLVRAVHRLRLPLLLAALFRTLILIVVKLADVILALVSPLAIPLLLVPRVSISTASLGLTWLPLYQLLGGCACVGAVIGFGAQYLARM